ncbi:MAG: hypothetical protein AAB848_01310, partial [Patescibacteria group bacterium]
TSGVTRGGDSSAPQACADKEPPMPALSSEFEVSIFKELQIDAGNSFDADGEITEYYLEVLPFESSGADSSTSKKLKTTQLSKFIWSDKNYTVDSNKDGIFWNDRDNPIMKVGPFINEGDIGVHEMILHIVDQSGNSSKQKITINVFAPEITLNETLAKSFTATGETNPRVPNFPFKLMRTRYSYRVIDDILKLIPQTETLIDAITSADGSYNISDFDLSNIILVKNAKNEVVAEIDPETGNISIVKDGYMTVVNKAHSGSPTSVDIKDNNGLILGTIYAVADSNQDVTIFDEFGFNSENFKDLDGVNVDDIDAEDDFVFINLPANDLKNPGAAALIYKPEKKALALIDTSGNILIWDKRIT